MAGPPFPTNCAKELAFPGTIPGCSPGAMAESPFPTNFVKELASQPALDHWEMDQTAWWSDDIEAEEIPAAAVQPDTGCQRKNKKTRHARKKVRQTDVQTKDGLNEDADQEEA